MKSKGGETVWSGSIVFGYLKSTEITYLIFLKIAARVPEKMNQVVSDVLKIDSQSHQFAHGETDAILKQVS